METTHFRRRLTQRFANLFFSGSEEEEDRGSSSMSEHQERVHEADMRRAHFAAGKVLQNVSGR